MDVISEVYLLHDLLFTKVKTMMLKDFLFALKDLWKRYLQHAIDLFLDVLVFRTGPSPTMAFDNLEPFTT